MEAGSDNLVVLNFVKLDATPPTLSTSMHWGYPGDPSYIVYDDDADPVTWVSGLRFGQNVFTWTVENGKCLVADQVTITYNPVPNGFSPDGNGINDLFEIPGLEGTENELVITSGTGAEIRRFKDYSSESGYWDGMDRNGKYLPDGTYYYFLTITNRQGSSQGGQPARLNGFVVIKRLNYD
ncbi:MAG: gliding motility-associated C-terminal domain-containing protein [Comamonadaceae bacterium]|nr:gliding motility-associated C-terminal domain-containing protein [Comamonadaceae bacterium]